MKRTKFPKTKEDLAREGQKVVNWIRENEQRFNNVKKDSEAYFRDNGHLIPPEFWDFVEYLDAAKRDPFEPITDKDFLKYHKWRVRVMNEPEPKKEKEYSVRAGGLCLVMARKAGLISDEVWGTDDLRVYAEKTFSIGSGHKTRIAAKKWEHFLSDAEEKWPKDYELAKVLFSKYF